MDYELITEMLSVAFYIYMIYTKEWAFKTIPSLLILKMMTIYHMYAKYSLHKLYVVA